MPPPVFCGKGPTAGHTGPAPTHPMMDFRRAACPHAAARDGQCRPPTDGFGDGATGPMWASAPTVFPFFLTKSPSAPFLGRSVLLDFDFYFLALLSTTRRSRAANASRDMAPRSPSARCRGETVPFSMSRSPTTTM